MLNLVGIGALLILARKTLELPKGCCVKCRYSLEGLTGPICPECGYTRVTP